jgi:hypothetical protein
MPNASHGLCRSTRLVAPRTLRAATTECRRREPSQWRAPQGGAGYRGGPAGGPAGCSPLRSRTAGSPSSSCPFGMTCMTRAQVDLRRSRRIVILPPNPSGAARVVRDGRHPATRGHRHAHLRRVEGLGGRRPPIRSVQTNRRNHLAAGIHKPHGSDEGLPPVWCRRVVVRAEHAVGVAWARTWDTHRSPGPLFQIWEPPHNTQS